MKVKQIERKYIPITDIANRIIMIDVALICGALSAVSKVLASEILYRRSDIGLFLADIPYRENELIEYVNELRSKNPNSIIHYAFVDVTDCDCITKIFSKYLEEEYRIKYFVYAVGTNKLENAFHVTEDNWDQIMNVNLKGFFFCAQYIGSLLMQNGGGSIVSIASQHGVAPNYDRSVYCASKAGMIHLSQVLALEWAKYNIRVNTVSPTFIQCEGNESVVGNEFFSNKWLKTIPMHRFAKPLDVVNAILFLLFEQSMMITGENILIDGGWHLSH